MDRSARNGLNIIIVGGGLGGLAIACALKGTPHHVTVLESKPSFEEPGAGIQLTPNSTRLLANWGLGDELKGAAVSPSHGIIKRGEDGVKLEFRPVSIIAIHNGAPWYTIQRSELHSILLKSITGTTQVRTSAEVIAVSKVPPKDDSAAIPPVSVELTNGDLLEADLVIIANGRRSKLREVLYDDPMTIISRTVLFRDVIPIEHLKKDPELTDLISTPILTHWISPKFTAIGYPISSRLYNILIAINEESINDLKDGHKKSPPLSLPEILTPLGPLDKGLVKLTELMTAYRSWTLGDVVHPKTWIHSMGGVVLLGDAAHSVMPHGAQGAALAFEDATVLGSLLQNPSVLQPDTLQSALQEYELLRKGRCLRTQKFARSLADSFSLTPGSAAVDERDKRWRKSLELEKVLIGMSPEDAVKMPLDERIINREQYGYDAAKGATGI